MLSTLISSARNSAVKWLRFQPLKAPASWKQQTRLLRLQVRKQKHQFMNLQQVLSQQLLLLKISLEQMSKKNRSDSLQLNSLKKMIKLDSSLQQFLMFQMKSRHFKMNLMMIQKVLLQMRDIHIFLQLLVIV